MTSRKDIFTKYFASDIFNQNPKFGIKQVKPKLRLNRSTLENTKEDVFNIGLEKRINRNNDQNIEKEQYISKSAEKRRKNISKIYGSDIFNTRKAPSLKRKGKRVINQDRNNSTCFEEMKNNEEYRKDLQYYYKEHRGQKKEFIPGCYLETVSPQERYYDNYYENHCEGILLGSYLKSEGDIDESKLRYIKKKINLHKNERLFNDVGVDKKRKEGEKAYLEIRYAKRNPISMFRGDKRRFVDLDEYPENNCRINKQIQFESHIFTNDKNNYNKSNEEIEAINARIEREKHKHYHMDVLGQPIIKVNRNNGIFSRDRNLSPANIKWSSPQAEIMFGTHHSKSIYDKFGSKGPNSYQIKLYQCSDSGNFDTLSGVQKPLYYNMKRPKKEEAINDETTEKIRELVNNLQNLNERQKQEIKMKTSVLDCKDDNDWENKLKNINDYYKNPKNKRKRSQEITEKVNSINKKTNDNKDYGFQDYVITYGNKGNQFEKFNDKDIKRMFGTKGLNAYDIRKNPFPKGNYNTITLKVSGSDNNNEISNKVKLVQEDLNKKNFRINIEKGGNKNNKKSNKRMMNYLGPKIGIMPDSLTNYEGSKFKIMPNDYKKRKGFTREFNGVNYEYKKYNP